MVVILLHREDQYLKSGALSQPRIPGDRTDQPPHFIRPARLDLRRNMKGNGWWKS